MTQQTVAQQSIFIDRSLMRTQRCRNFALLSFIVLTANIADRAKPQHSNDRVKGDVHTTRQAATTQSNAEEAKRLGVDKLFGSAKLRNFGRTPVFSPDGKFVIGCSPWKFNSFEIKTGELREVPLNSYLRALGQRFFSPDGSKAIICSVVGDFSMWNTETGDVLFRHTFDASADRIDDIAWSPNGERFVTAHSGGSVKVWDGTTGHLIKSNRRAVPEVGVSSNRCAWSPEDGYYACGGVDDENRISVFDANTHQEVRLIDAGFRSRINFELVGLRFASDDELIACGKEFGAINGEDQLVTELKLWTATTGELLQTFPMARETPRPDAICLTPDRSEVVVKAGMVIHFFDVRSGGLTKEINGLPYLPDCDRIEISPDGSRLVYGGDMLMLVDVATGAWLGNAEGLGHAGDSFRSLSPDTKWLITVGENDARLIIWDTESCQPVSSISLGHPLSVGSFDWAPDGSLFYLFAYRTPSGMFSSDCPLSIMAFDPLRRSKIFEATFPNYIRGIPGLMALTTDSKQIALFHPESMSRDEEGATVEFLDAKNAKPLRQLEIPETNTAETFRMTPDGKYLLATFSQGQQRFRIWDALTGECVHAEQGPDRGRAYYTRDGRKFVGIIDGEAVVYDTVLRQELHRIKIPGMQVDVVDIVDGERLFTIRGYKTEIGPEGRGIARYETGIWDLESGERVQLLSDWKGSARFKLSADGRFIYGDVGVPAAWRLERFTRESPR